MVDDNYDDHCGGDCNECDDFICYHHPGSAFDDQDDYEQSKRIALNYQGHNSR